MDRPRVEADLHRERLDEIFAAVAVVERPGPEEEGDGASTEGSGRSSQVIRTRALPKRQGMLGGGRQVQGADHRRDHGQSASSVVSCLASGRSARHSTHSGSPRPRACQAGDEVGARALRAPTRRPSGGVWVPRLIGRESGSPGRTSDDEISRAVVRAAVPEPVPFLERHGHPRKVRRPGRGPGERQRFGEQVRGRNVDPFAGWLGSAVDDSRDNVVRAIDLVVHGLPCQWLIRMKQTIPGP